MTTTVYITTMPYQLSVIIMQAIFMKRLLTFNTKCGHNFMLFTDKLKRSDCYDSYLFNIINVSTKTLIQLHTITVMTHCLSYS